LTADRTIQQHITDNSTFTVIAITLPHLTYTILILCKITDLISKAAFLIYKLFISYFFRFRNTSYPALPTDHTKS